MKLSETENVYSVDVKVRDGVKKNPELNLVARGYAISLDQQTAAEFLPILQHFIETGELPE